MTTKIVCLLDDNEYPNGDRIQAAVARTLGSEGVLAPLVVTVVITGDEHIQRLNHDFMDEDKVTDVLSFNNQTGWKNGSRTILEDSVQGVEDDDYLGDIIICEPQVRRQAREVSVRFEDELVKLVIHGALHLLGYDHSTEQEEVVMFGKTDSIIADLRESNYTVSDG